MQNNLVNFQTRHRYFNDIYDDLHPHHDKKNRIYKSLKNDNDFFFKDNKLLYSKQKNLEFSQKSLNKFSSFSNKEFDPEKMNVQNRISFYLSNNLVPV